MVVWVEELLTQEHTKFPLWHRRGLTRAASLQPLLNSQTAPPAPARLLCPTVQCLCNVGEKPCPCSWAVSWEMSSVYCQSLYTQFPSLLSLEGKDCVRQTLYWCYRCTTSTNPSGFKVPFWSLEDFKMPRVIVRNIWVVHFGGPCKLCCWKRNEPQEAKKAQLSTT